LQFTFGGIDTFAPTRRTYSGMCAAMPIEGGVSGAVSHFAAQSARHSGQLGRSQNARRPPGH